MVAAITDLKRIVILRSKLEPADPDGEVRYIDCGGADLLIKARIRRLKEAWRNIEDDVLPERDLLEMVERLADVRVKLIGWGFKDCSAVEKIISAML